MYQYRTQFMRRASKARRFRPLAICQRERKQLHCGGFRRIDIMQNNPKAAERGSAEGGLSLPLDAREPWSTPRLIVIAATDGTMKFPENESQDTEVHNS
jgi:hypothetical protein